MNKIGMAVIGAAAAGALVLTGCGTGMSSSSRSICVDRITNMRVDDNRCGSNNSAFIPWYLNSGQTAPSVGAKPKTGSATIPKGTKVDKAPVPKTGGKINTSKSGSGSSSGSKSSSGSSKSSSSGGSKSSSGSVSRGK